MCDKAVFRAATHADLVALRDLEREANLAALGHVFPPDRYPFPDDAVLARWALVLDDPDVAAIVAEKDGAIVAYAAYDSTTLRHLAVRPDHWGLGIASAALDVVAYALDRRGCTIASLWCLEENHRARRFYTWHGWRPTAECQTAAWPPHPVERRWTRLVPQSDR